MPLTKQLLVVDDEPSIGMAIQRVFRETDIDVETAVNVAEGLSCFQRIKPDAAIVDVHLPDGSGLDLFLQFKQIDARVPVILITGHATNETAIEAMRQGAFDYLFKPLDADELMELVNRAVRVSQTQREPVSMGEPSAGSNDSQIIGKSESMREVYKSIGRVADNDVTVLITGESGVGKELVARAIYQHSRRNQQMFSAINCAAIPETLLESEIFGHEKSAFTGADSRRIGKFEQCCGGTLFLDEVGEMSSMTQAKILRVIEEKQFERVGGNEVIKTDVRLIAATNRNLDKMVADGSFREDLYYRLTAFTIEIAPLRDRASDIPDLVAYFLQRLNRELNKSIQGVSSSAMDSLCKYSWPGNVRELQNFLRQWMLMTTGSQLTDDQMPKMSSTISTAQSQANPFNGTEFDQFVSSRLQSGSDALYAEVITAAERRLFERILAHTSDNLSMASRLLGINRRTLRTKLQSLGIRAD